nr:VTT domain-containing protein [Succinivibrionaceae bacterium]
MTEYILNIFNDNFFLSNFGIVCFIIINIVLLILCFPAWILTVCAGFLYGTLLGLFYELISIIVSTYISYFIGEKFPINKKKYVANEYFKQMFRSDSFDSFVLIFLLKVNPIVPFTPVIYYLGYIRYSLF